MSSSRRLIDESGQTVVIAALCMVVIIAFLGLAIDVGHLRYTKRNLQSAADAAALAAALEVRICGTTPNCDAMKTAAVNALAENGLTVTQATTVCPSSIGVGITLTINNPPSCLGSSDPNSHKQNYVEAIVSEQIQTYLARIVGFNNMTITARAEAARGLHEPCIYALNPHGFGAISVIAALGVRANCEIVDESDDPSALNCLVGLLISAPKISVTGGTSGLLCTSTPPAVTNVARPNPADPLAYLPPPSTANDACGKSTSSPYYGSSSPVGILLGLGSHIVFNPGVYCGGITITAGIGTDITFMPGTYILRDKAPGFLGLGGGGGLNITVSALSNIAGNGVMFYNEGPNGSLSLTIPASILTNFNLSAQTSGEYGGILFFQAHGVTAAGNYVVNLLQPGNRFEGAIYMPDGDASYGVSALGSSYNILVAKDINFIAAVLSTFGNDYSTLVSGSPINGDSATLVQ